MNHTRYLNEINNKARREEEKSQRQDDSYCRNRHDPEITTTSSTNTDRERFKNRLIGEIGDDTQIQKVNEGLKDENFQAFFIVFQYLGSIEVDFWVIM